MSKYYVIVPGNISAQLEKMLEAVLNGKETNKITDKSNLPDLKEKKIIICVEISPAGFCMPLYEIMEELQSRRPDTLQWKPPAACQISLPGGI